jgi:hypothetical protein
MNTSAGNATESLRVSEKFKFFIVSLLVGAEASPFKSAALLLPLF